MNEKALTSISRANARRMRRPRQLSLAELERICQEWNAAYPVGTAVRFHPVIGEEAHRNVKTSSEAWVLSGHTPVVKLEDVAGCVALEACEPYVTPEEAELKPTAQLGEDLKALRRLFALSITHVSAVTGVSEATLRRLESGAVSNCSGAIAMTLCTWAASLGCKQFAGFTLTINR